MTTIKSTVNINQIYMDELKLLVSKQMIGSLTEGINLGIAMLIKDKKKELYAKEIKQAASDNDFLERTLGAQRDFANLDSEVPGEW